ncbi:hypothetical protein BC939DRAFT_452322 [Gamsiella multidivaricata]|uniref:uncharacterized protein n=1 Tax=Gamsiella multidivaricata TaxID=101098 RepID=UPI0022210F11|nr:uncharacterized protein BC939DRAFT_452322 [Gamsiella multidivaricata]KAI7823270.1 hypothetical protein BC939DRAFT_452322 [Gamsiella multidivaricata]
MKDTIHPHQQALHGTQPTGNIDISHTQFMSSMAMPPPSQAPHVTIYGNVVHNDLTQVHSGLMTSSGGMKRRFSTGAATGGAGAVGPMATRSPLLQTSRISTENGSGTSIMGYSAMGDSTPHTAQSLTGLPTVSGMARSSVPLASPSITSPVLVASTLTTGNATSTSVAKGGKRARNSSALSVAVSNSASKASAVGGTSSNGTVRNRKGTGKKESSSKRKDSVIEENGSLIPASTSISAVMSGASNSENAEGVGSATPAKARMGKMTGSPVSAPSPTTSPAAGSFGDSSSQGESSETPSGGIQLSRLRQPRVFENISANFYSNLISNQSILAPSGGVHGLDMDGGLQMPPSNYIQSSEAPAGTSTEESESWAGSMDFMGESRGLDIGEFIFDPGYDAQDADSISAQGVRISVNGSALPPNSTTLTTIGMNGAAV